MRRKVFKYKGISVNAFGIPVEDTFTKKVSAKRKRADYCVSFDSPFAEGASKNLILMYDIPDDMKKERDWFRRQLSKFGFGMIQKSVWVGPSPLPKEFVKYLKEIDLNDKFKTFKLAKSYNL